eukprot:20577-Heterococcus_DN1.PRE.1
MQCFAVTQPVVNRTTHECSYYQVIALEGSNMNYQTFRAMQSGAKAMQQARGQLDVDDVDQVMDDIQEEMDIADQIGDAIARPADGLFDDDDLLAELAMMEEADMEDQLLSTPAIPQQEQLWCSVCVLVHHAYASAIIITLYGVISLCPISDVIVQEYNASYSVYCCCNLRVFSATWHCVPRVPVAASAEEDEDAKALRELEASMAL